MRDPILVATDFSEASDSAMRRAAFEARASETSLIAMHCVEIGDNQDRWSRTVQRAGFKTTQIRTEALGRLDEQFNEAVDDKYKPNHIDYHVDVGRAPDRIREAADEKGAGLIVLGGSEGGAFQRLVLGSVSEEIVRSATKPVMVVPPDASLDSVEEILAPVDFSECSRASLDAAVQWAERVGARLVALHVFQPDRPVPPFSIGQEIEDDGTLRERAAANLTEFVGDIVPGELEVETIVEMGPPGEAIRTVAKDRNPDLLVMGTHGRRGLEKFIVGSTALDVLRRAEWPVVTLRDHGS